METFMKVFLNWDASQKTSLVSAHMETFMEAFLN